MIRLTLHRLLPGNENSGSSYPASTKHLFPWKTGLSRESWPPVFAVVPWFARFALKHTATLTDKPTSEKNGSNQLKPGWRRSLTLAPGLPLIPGGPWDTRSTLGGVCRSSATPADSSGQRRRTLSPGSPLDPTTPPPTATGSPWQVEKVFQTDELHSRVLKSSIPTHLFSLESLLSSVSLPAFSTGRASLPLRPKHAGIGDNLEVKTRKICSTKHAVPGRPFSPEDLEPARVESVKSHHHSVPRHEITLCLC